MRRRLIDVEPVVSIVADHLDKLGGVRGGHDTAVHVQLTRRIRLPLPTALARKNRGEQLVAKKATSRVPALQNSSAES